MSSMSSSPVTSPEPPRAPVPFPLGWAMRCLLAVTLPLAGVSVVAARGLGYAQQGALIAVAFGSCLLGGVVAMVMVRSAARGAVSQLLVTILAGTGVRVAFAAAGGAVAVMAMGYPKRATGLWLLLAYFSVMAVEVAVFSNYIMMLTPPAKPPSDDGHAASDGMSQDTP